MFVACLVISGRAFAAKASDLLEKSRKLFDNLLKSWQMTAPSPKGESADDQAGRKHKVAKADWGLKRICTHCGTRYYDMKKNPPVCPHCGTAFDPETLVRSRRSRSAAPAVEEKAKRPDPEMIEDLPVIDEAADEDAVIEDADELGEDDMGVDDVGPIEDENESRS